MKRFWLILAAFLGLAATSVPASADMVFNLNQGGSAFATDGTVYGTVTLHQKTSTTVTVTVKLNGGATFAGTNAGYAIAWNIGTSDPAPAITVTLASSSTGYDKNNFELENYNPSSGGYAKYKATPFTGGSCGATTAACFDYAIDYKPSGGTGDDYKLVFDVTKAGGLLLTDFGTNSKDGAHYYFASDIFFDCDTGNVAAISGKKVPEPSTWMLSFMGLFGLAFMGRRRKLARA